MKIIPNGKNIVLKNNFFLVRHGESKNNLIQVESCRIDQDEKDNILTPSGIEQINNSAKELHTNIDVIVSSPFTRTKETAYIFQKHFPNSELIIDDRIKELDVGDIHNTSYQNTIEFTNKNNIIDTPFPNGESISELRKRFQGCIKELNKKYENKNILLATHGGPSVYLIQGIKGFYSDKFNILNLPKNGEIVHLNSLAR